MRRWLVCSTLLLTGCAATFSDPRVAAGESHTEWNHFFLFGSVGHAVVDVRDVCPTGRAHEVSSGENVLTLGVSVVTLGIYTPRKVKVVCEKAAPR
ncbi:MAG: hypothetical protein KC776_40710 [Myxococcales bacterium]|nr:hypothetical protein [Myxococcales bacterium]MCB9577580.1 hypothetical protein [Polyangiaceae bacterium]